MDASLSFVQLPGGADYWKTPYPITSRPVSSQHRCDTCVITSVVESEIGLFTDALSGSWDIRMGFGTFAGLSRRQMTLGISTPYRCADFPLSSNNSCPANLHASMEECTERQIFRHPLHFFQFTWKADFFCDAGQPLNENILMTINWAVSLAIDLQIRRGTAAMPEGVHGLADPELRHIATSQRAASASSLSEAWEFVQAALDIQQEERTDREMREQAATTAVMRDLFRERFGCQPDQLLERYTNVVLRPSLAMIWCQYQDYSFQAGIMVLRFPPTRELYGADVVTGIQSMVALGLAISTAHGLGPWLIHLDNGRPLPRNSIHPGRKKKRNRQYRDHFAIGLYWSRLPGVGQTHGSSAPAACQHLTQHSKNGPCVPSISTHPASRLSELDCTVERAAYGFQQPIFRSNGVPIPRWTATSPTAATTLFETSLFDDGYIIRLCIFHIDPGSYCAYGLQLSPVQQPPTSQTTHNHKFELKEQFHNGGVEVWWQFSAYAAREMKTARTMKGPERMFTRLRIVDDSTTVGVKRFQTPSTTNSTPVTIPLVDGAIQSSHKRPGNTTPLTTTPSSSQRHDPATPARGRPRGDVTRATPCYQCPKILTGTKKSFDSPRIIGATVTVSGSGASSQNHPRFLTLSRLTKKSLKTLFPGLSLISRDSGGIIQREGMTEDLARTRTELGTVDLMDTEAVVRDGTSADKPKKRRLLARRFWSDMRTRAFTARIQTRRKSARLDAEGQMWKLLQQREVGSSEDETSGVSLLGSTASLHNKLLHSYLQRAVKGFRLQEKDGLANTARPFNKFICTSCTFFPELDSWFRRISDASNERKRKEWISPAWVHNTARPFDSDLYQIHLYLL
ncbi:hypothetical protein L249_1311 [Ophiocordyceps polyrhachis-furcata BCC 54312]|uniref:Uncharacterized protein n=1 Tax=Ophiocordyceps polyrhachis-furcata BCC 54312 TaxID=1330021 RepID=A0A367LDK0_9HYPO|nr:hypothetical protein L249_1311 [Ophiocordyceps polyrhachis-furcata BCC 54312]